MDEDNEENTENQFNFYNNPKEININVINRNRRAIIGNLSNTIPINELCESSNEHYDTIYYHRVSQRDLSNWGGPRTKKFEIEDEENIQGVIFTSLVDNRSQIRSDLVREVSTYGYEINNSWITNNCFKPWGWSFKKGESIPWRKYTANNIERYDIFINFMHELPLESYSRIKYIDEAHFCDRKTYSKNGYSAIGESWFQVRDDILQNSASITLATNIDENGHDLPLIFNYREDSNTDIDWVLFLEEICEMDFLRDGDIAIIDNARTHTSDFARNEMNRLEEEYNIDFVYQPPFAPEVNACELVFAEIKNGFRIRRKDDILNSLINFCANSDKQTLRNYYRKCILL